MINKKNLRIILAVTLLLVFLHLTKIILPLENYLINFIKPAQKNLTLKGNSFSNFINYLFNSTKLIEENRELELEREQLLFDHVHYELLENENESLKKSLNYLENNNYQFISAQVIGSSMDNPQKLILDKGKKEGLKKDLPVFYENGIMLGKIYQVEEEISYLLLLTDNQSQLAAKLINSNETIGIVRGELGINTKLEMVPKEEELEVGEIVITSGLEKYVPEGLLIGEIGEVNNQPEALFKEAIINYFFNVKYINMVTIILPTYE